ncbi:MAG: Dot/Icm type IV secretion system effector LegD1 [Candidatus Velthaea sp.]
MIASGLREAFERDGYAIVPDFIDARGIAALRARAERIVAEGTQNRADSAFSAREQSDWKPDDSFLNSGYAVRAFREENSDAINKIGHALHDLDSVFSSFSHTARLDGFAREFGLTDPRIYQSTYIFKAPRVGGEVRWHQDATYFVTDPQTVIAFWFALDDADRDNGCLWAVPGTHGGPLRERFVVDAGRAVLERLDDTPWPAVADAQPLEVRAGTLVVMHGLLPHASGANSSARSRHAYILHVVDGTARYSPRNWLQRTDVPAGGFIPS